MTCAGRQPPASVPSSAAPVPGLNNNNCVLIASNALLPCAGLNTTQTHACPNAGVRRASNFANSAELGKGKNDTSFLREDVSQRKQSTHKQCTKHIAPSWLVQVVPAPQSAEPASAGSLLHALCAAPPYRTRAPRPASSAIAAPGHSHAGCVRLQPSLCPLNNLEVRELPVKRAPLT